jgi:hypothetical protein
VRHLEASRHAAGTVYALFDGHQNGDFRNWLYRSTDYGRTWTSIAADVPAARVPQVLREDLASPDLLYLGTEFGLFVSTDRGAHWLPMPANLPTVPVYDIALHPRDHALVLATHGRGIWILDDVRPLRRLAAGLDVPVAIAPLPAVVYQQRLSARQTHTGDMIFRGENPAAGLTVTVLARDSGTTATLVVRRVGDTTEIWRQPVTTRRGATTATWSLRRPSLPPLPVASGGEDDAGPRRGVVGAFVPAGDYEIALSVADRVIARDTVAVRPDRRQDATPATFRAWYAGLDSIATLYRATATLAERARAAGADARPRADTFVELQTRLGALYQALEPQVGAPSADMRAQLASYARVYARLERAMR